MEELLDETVLREQEVRRAGGAGERERRRGGGGDGRGGEGGASRSRLAPSMAPRWRDFAAMVGAGQARLKLAYYFCCFSGEGPSREFWFEFARDKNFEQALPAHEIMDGRLVRGHVVVHVHFAGTDAERDFCRIEHVNVRLAVDKSRSDFVQLRRQHGPRDGPPRLQPHGGRQGHLVHARRRAARGRQR